jgi:hypothetical protein
MAHVQFTQVPNSTSTHSEYIIRVFIALQLQQWLDERASILRCTYIACLVIYYPGSNDMN